MTSQTGAERDDQLLTVADIAGHVEAHGQTVRGWIHGGALKASKFGARIGWRIRRADYDDFRQLLYLGAIGLVLAT